VRVDIEYGIVDIVECPKEIELHVYDFDVANVDEEDLCTCEENKPHIHFVSYKGDEINEEIEIDEEIDN
jgi:hypothetical protein